MAKLCQLSAPVVTCGTRLHSDKARLLFFEKLQKLGSPDRTVECNRSIRGDAMNLKDILGQVQADCGNLHWVVPLVNSCGNCIMAHCDAGSRNHPPHLLLVEAV